MADVCLTVRCTNRAEMKVGYIDQVTLYGNGYRLLNKRYIRDNRLIFLGSPYTRKSLAPRCRLVATRG